MCSVTNTCFLLTFPSLVSDQDQKRKDLKATVALRLSTSVVESLVLVLVGTTRKILRSRKMTGETHSTTESLACLSSSPSSCWFGSSKIYLFINPWSGIIVYSQDWEGVRGERSSSKCVDQGCNPHTNSLEASQCMRTYATSA